MQEVKRLLKTMNSEIFYKILTISGLEEQEYKLIQEFILRDESRDEVCKMLNVSRSTFRDIKNKALLKIKLSLTNLLDEKIKQIKH